MLSIRIRSSLNLQPGAWFVGLFEHGEGRPRLAQRFSTRTATWSPTFPMRPSVSVTSPQRTVDQRVGLEFEHQRVADLEIHHLPQGQRCFVQDGIDADLRPGRSRWPDGLPRSDRGRTSRP